VVGVPLAAWLAFKGGMGIHGFWWGVAAGAAVQVRANAVLNAYAAQCFSCHGHQAR
jgi:Na+-driven multidrug efflux pump